MEKIKRLVEKKKSLYKALFVLFFLLLSSTGLLLYTSTTKEKNTDIVSVPEKKEKVYLIGGYTTMDTYGGIGVSFNLMPRFDEKGIIITGVKENSPAQKAGIKTSDLVIKINDTDTTQRLGVSIQSLFRGEPGSIVKLSVLRNDKILEFNIKRDTVCCNEGAIPNMNIYSSEDFVQWSKVGTLDIKEPFYADTFTFKGKVFFLEKMFNSLNIASSSDLKNWLTYSHIFKLSSIVSEDLNKVNIHPAVVPSYEYLHAFFNVEQFKYKNSEEYGPVSEMEAEPLVSMRSKKFSYISYDGIEWSEDKNPSWWQDCDCSEEIEGSFLFKGKIYVIVKEHGTIESSLEKSKLYATDNSAYWTTINENLISGTIVPFKDNILLYSYTDQTKSTDIYTSIDGSEWQLAGTADFLNSPLYYNPFYTLNEKVFFLRDIYDPREKQLYSSSNGVQWEKEDISKTTLSDLNDPYKIVLPNSMNLFNK
ncbi:MAG: PDZ domain-containing protein [Candidatus Paceibacterota bacterium]|jgi:hypothetical protein